MRLNGKNGTKLEFRVQYIRPAAVIIFNGKNLLGLAVHNRKYSNSQRKAASCSRTTAGCMILVSVTGRVN